MTDTTQPTTAPRAAAEWWAAQVGAPTFRIVRTEERDFGSDFAELSALTTALRNPVSDEASTAFVDALEHRIAEALAKDTQRLANAADPEIRAMEPSVGLHVDYGPDGILADAAEATGVSLSRFPWKTRMWVHPLYVTAALGYGTRQVLVWSAPGWQRPVCGDQRYEGREPSDERCGRPRFHDSPCGDFTADVRRCGACGGSYTAHFGDAEWHEGRCREWFRTVTE